MFSQKIQADNSSNQFSTVIKNIYIMKNATRVGLSIIEAAGTYTDPLVFEVIKHNTEYAEALDAYLSSRLVTSIQRGVLLNNNASSPNYWAQITNPNSKPRLRQIPIQKYPGSSVLTFPESLEYKPYSSFAIRSPESLYEQFVYQVFTRTDSSKPIVLNFSYGPGTMIELIIRYNRNQSLEEPGSPAPWSYDDSIEFTAMELHPYGLLAEPTEGHVIFGRSQVGEPFKNFFKRVYSLHLMQEDDHFLAKVFHEVYQYAKLKIEKTPKTQLMGEWFKSEKHKLVYPFDINEMNQTSMQNFIRATGF